MKANKVAPAGKLVLVMEWFSLEKVILICYCKPYIE